MRNMIHFILLCILSFIHSLTRSLAHSLIYSYICSFIRWVTANSAPGAVGGAGRQQ